MDMWKSLTTGLRFGGTGAPALHAGEDEGKDEDMNYDDEQDENSRIEYAEAQLLPCEAEKKHILSMFYTMRKDSFFCDVAFVCNGVLFRAHRVVVSSWSRWLRALLCESPDEEVVSLDFFDATAFGAALDYMYGVPLTITVENADNVLKVVRRLEMQKLEQQCWRYLMTVINPDTNVEILHELADRYDCPPLKLAAWRILQEKMPNNGASLAAARLLKKGKEGMQAKLGVTGLTGPGEVWFNNSIGLGAGSHRHHDHQDGRLNVRGTATASEADYEEYTAAAAEEEEELLRAKRMMPSVFSELREGEEDEEDEDEQASLDEYYGSEDGSYRDRKNKFGWDLSNYRDPSELDATATAAEIVQAWAFRLKDIYDQCGPQSSALDYEDPDSFMLAANSPNVRLSTFPRPGARSAHTTRPAADKRGDLLGEADSQASPVPPPPLPRAQSQSDQYFKLVPSSSSVTGGGGSGGASAEGGYRQHDYSGAQQEQQEQQQQLGHSGGLRRPPPPSAKNTSNYQLDATLNSTGRGVSSSRWPRSDGYAAKEIDWREEMKRFYIAIGMPEKIAGISTILSTWAGKEEEMLSSLMEKYRTHIPTQLSNHLEQLIAHLETHTDSSFMKGYDHRGVVTTIAGGGGGGGGGGGNTGKGEGTARPPRSPQRKASSRGRFDV